MKSEVLEDDTSIYTNPIEKDTEEVQFILGLPSPCCVYCYFTVVFTVILSGCQGVDLDKENLWRQLEEMLLYLL